MLNNAVWVTSVDMLVSKVDPATKTVTTISVNKPSKIAVTQ